MTAETSGSGPSQAELPTRRRLLRRGALVSGAALAGGALAGLANSAPASAATGAAIVAGEQTNAESSTVLYADGANYGHGGLVVTDTGFASITDRNYASSAVAGVALSTATSELQTGVSGVGSFFGVYGVGGDGVHGEGEFNGVYGIGQTGVYGEGAAGGVGVEAYCPSGTGLSVVGKAVFSNSGVVSIPKGSISKAVTAASVTTASSVLATLQTADGAIGVASAVPGSGKFTITLTAAATKTVRVAWFVLN